MQIFLTLSVLHVLPFFRKHQGHPSCLRELVRVTGTQHRSVTQENRAPSTFLYPLTKDLSQVESNSDSCKNRCLSSVPQLEIKKRRMPEAGRDTIFSSS